MGVERRRVSCGGGVAAAALVVAGGAWGATGGETDAAWAARLLAGRAALVEEAPCRGTTPMLERYGPMLEGTVGPRAQGDSSVGMTRVAMTMGIERLREDWAEGADLPGEATTPAYAVERLGERVDPALVRSFAGRVLGLRRNLVRVHGAEMGVRARLVILSLLRQVIVADARAGFFPDPLAARGRRDLLEFLDSVLVGFSTDDQLGRGLPPDLFEAGLARLSWFDGLFPLQRQRVAALPRALASLARALSAGAEPRDRLDAEEVGRLEELARSALPPPEVFALPPRERLLRLEAWRPHLNARTREGELWPAEDAGTRGDRPRALLGAMLSSLELTDDCVAELRVQALVRALAVAWAAAVFRQRHGGRAPTTWEELGPMVPEGMRVDPINGRLLRFGPDLGEATAVWSDGFRETPGRGPGDDRCVGLVPCLPRQWFSLFP